MSDFLTIKPASELHTDNVQSRFLLDEVSDSNLILKKSLQRIQRILVQKTRPFFVYDCEDGMLDNTALTQLISNPAKKNYYKQKKDGQIPSTCVTFLLDSGFYHNDEIARTMASMLDITLNMLEKSSINSELYGCDGINIIKYKGTFDTWNKSKVAISKLLMLEKVMFNGWDNVLKTIIFRQKKYYDDKKVLFFLTSTPLDAKTESYAKRNNITYVHLDLSGAGGAMDIQNLFITKLSSIFGLKFKKI